MGIKPWDTIKEKETLWIFGYGSLVWKPGFAFKRSKVGHITGYKRRFWHGDEFHRGDKVKVRPAFKSKGVPAYRILTSYGILFCIYAAWKSGHIGAGSRGKSSKLKNPGLIECFR